MPSTVYDGVLATMARIEQELSAGARVAAGLRPGDGGPRIDHRGVEDPGRGVAAGRAGDVPVPAELAQHDHSGADHPGVAHRHLRLRQAVRLLDQHADAVRHRAGHRHRRRRRDRRRREHRAPHARVRQVGLPGRRRCDAGGVQCGHRHRHRAGGGVRAGGVLPRHHRPALPAVLPDHRLRRRALGVQRPHAHAGAGGVAARQARATASTAGSSPR